MNNSRNILDNMSMSMKIIDNTHDEIIERGKELMECFKNGDVGGVVSMYDTDAELLTSNVPICRGIDALRIYYTMLKKRNELLNNKEPYEIHALSPFLAIERGHCVNNCVNERIPIKNRYFILWIKRDIGWMIMQDCKL
ncbi:Hypothetical protein SRAE_1000204100 [Strongyloides ratti]|uniref:DUF4440 domain-containing protein n=1 Tax=Strongyloides ratti TaxID=34506 RepID=A0A090L6Q6_STRRB|nr:Hypothetical protein SRAE_1000204100 [Strongyloides ratti]CEF63783.1 Hypothetical protein SRAE_1000204100 [Strongyloides ratti]